MRGVISFDIGMKHLAIAMLWYTKSKDEVTIEPGYWTLVDFIKDHPECSSVLKNGKTCGKQAKYESSMGSTCGTHKTPDAKAKKKTNCNRMNVQDIARKYIETVLPVFDDVIAQLKVKKQELQIDVVLELQPRFNRKMTMICDWIYINLYEKLLRNGIDTKKVYFMKAGMKLKEQGLTYTERKKKACNMVADFLSGKEPYHNMFENIRMSDTDKKEMMEKYTGKKDDLADALIMAIRYISPKQQNPGPKLNSTRRVYRRKKT